jgi:chemotaxis methyl-accepting protein methylase
MTANPEGNLYGAPAPMASGSVGVLGREAEERFGIKADPDDIEKLHAYLWNTYGAENQEIINKVFSSGEAADFLTVNETYFFREPAHFSFLWDLLPSFEKMGIRICCAAVASGCEAYSVAMMIEAYNRGAAAPLLYHIDAFDINHKVIETACRGVYGSRALREDGSCFRYMTDPYLNKTENEYRVEQSLKKNIRFFVHNLMDEIPLKEYDIIFFRNAFIYFSQRNRGRILSNLSKVLGEGGILLLGVSETAGAHNACSDAGLDEKNRKDVFYFQKESIYRNGIV